MNIYYIITGRIISLLGIYPRERIRSACKVTNLCICSKMKTSQTCKYLQAWIVKQSRIYEGNTTQKSTKHNKENMGKFKKQHEGGRQIVSYKMKFPGDCFSILEE